MHRIANAYIGVFNPIVISRLSKPEPYEMYEAQIGTNHMGRHLLVHVYNYYTNLQQTAPVS